MEYQWPPRNIETLPARSGVARAGRHDDLARANRADQRLGRLAGQILDGAVVRQDLHLVLGKRHRDEPIGVGRTAALSRNSARARAALAAR